LDTLAEQQAKALELNSTQLRRFFGEVKDIHRQFETRKATARRDEWDSIYRAEIEPRFKMVRSKVAYAKGRKGGTSVPDSFATFLDAGIRKVGSHAEFTLFVQHFEAVVGFMYGHDKITDRSR